VSYVLAPVPYLSYIYLLESMLNCEDDGEENTTVDLVIGLFWNTNEEPFWDRGNKGSASTAMIVVSAKSDALVAVHNVHNLTCPQSVERWRK